MHFLKYIELNNYLNLKHAKLEGLKDLNIIIGPNNCGKTSLLRAVNLLNRIDFGRPGSGYSCDICNKVFSKNGNVQIARVSIVEREKYLTTTKPKAIYGYYKSEIERVLPEISERQKQILNSLDAPKFIDHLDNEFRKEQLELVMRDVRHGYLESEHVSPIIWHEVKARIFDHILFCPDERLQTYKENNIPEHIKSKNFALDESNRLIEFLKEVVDPKISSIRQNLELVRDIENNRFNTLIAEQGSGVKSLICLVADILSATETKMLLIDEPELGLNPSSKHAFLRFLLEQSRDKQIFLATHDPTFVNPILWNRENVSVHLFSVVNNDFVKIDLAQSKQDPNTFAGFLPHTTSLKQVHIYVEGTYDVYIFQIFLDKYVKKRFREDWYRILNKIGIFHLGGDFWSHLLYTIPRRPYSSIVILDGDKKKAAEKVVSKYATIEKDRFQIFDSLDELTNEKRQKKLITSTPCPVYCLKRGRIEEYLETKLGTIPISKENGPSVAHEMKYVPTEIEVLFNVVLQMADIHNK